MHQREKQNRATDMIYLIVLEKKLLAFMLRTSCRMEENLEEGRTVSTELVRSDDVRTGLSSSGCREECYNSMSSFEGNANRCADKLNVGMQKQGESQR